MPSDSKKINSCPRVRRVVSLFQPLRRDVRVNLRRDEMRVAEQFLHAPQIRTRVQQMRRVTVPQLVRRQTRIEPGDGEKLFQPPRNGTRPERRAFFCLYQKNRRRTARRLLERV